MALLTKLVAHVMVVGRYQVAKQYLDKCKQLVLAQAAWARKVD